MVRCSIIIPVYNKASLTRQCVDALLAERPRVSHEIIVVDDASTDSTPKLLAIYGQRVRSVTHKSNGGFANSCNDGAAAAKGELLMFLNNDTIPHSGWLDEMVAYADAHPKASVVGAKMLFPDGTVQHAGVCMCQDKFPRHIYAGFPGDHPAVNKSRRFQIVTGGCALIRRNVFEKFRGFDTAFRNGYEDVDFCLRLGEAHHEIHYCHTAVLHHLESVSRDLRSAQEAHNNALYRSKWADKVKPDDVQYYLEDQLLRVDYNYLFPIRMDVSPELAVFGGDRNTQADRLLDARARQFLDLLKENIHLQVRLAESELHVATAAPANGKHEPAPAKKLPPRSTPPRLLHRGEIHWLTDEPGKRLISILIPVKNGAKDLKQLLPKIMQQQIRDRVEIVAVDSGSRDDSVKILKKHGATVVKIDPQAFNHGGTRNLLAGYARGEILVYVVQDAMPADEHWLANLVAPLDADATIAAVCSRAIPSPDADLLVEKDTLGDPNGSAERSVRVITDREKYNSLSPHTLRLFINFHNMSSATRASILKKFPYEHVKTFGEDLIFAKKLLEAGYKIQHEPSSVVLHSHNYSLSQILQRNFDDAVVSADITGRSMNENEIAPLAMNLARSDWQYIDAKDLPDADRDDWKMTAVLRRAALAVGQYLGCNRDRMPVDLAPLLSMTDRIKAGNAPAASAETGELVR